MNIVFNNKKTNSKTKEIIEKEILKFLKENENEVDFETKKESFLRNRNYSFSIDQDFLTIYSLK